MRGRREKHNIIGRGRCVHSFIQTISSLQSPASSPHCKLAAAVIAEKVHSDVHRWNDSGCYDSKRKGLFTVSFSLHYACLGTALVMWSRGQRSQSTQSKTRLCINVFRRQTLGNGYSLFYLFADKADVFIQSWNISSFRELGQLNQYEDLLCKTKSKEAIVLSSYVVEKFGLCDGLCKTVNDY